MPVSHYEYSQLCSAIYLLTEERDVPLPAGWHCERKSIDRDFPGLGIAFFIKTEGTRRDGVICVRGTILHVENFMSNFMLIFSKLPYGIVEARKFVTDIRKSPHYSSSLASLTITGHSLGAVYAEILSIENYMVGVTFDSPGTGSLFPDCDQRTDIITSYLSAPNPINTLHPHLGKLFRVYSRHSGCDEDFIIESVKATWRHFGQLATRIPNREELDVIAREVSLKKALFQSLWHRRRDPLINAMFGMIWGHVRHAYPGAEGVENLTSIVRSIVVPSSVVGAVEIGMRVVKLKGFLTWLLYQHSIERISASLGPRHSPSAYTRPILNWPAFTLFYPHYLQLDRLRTEILFHDLKPGVHQLKSVHRNKITERLIQDVSGYLVDGGDALNFYHQEDLEGTTLRLADAAKHLLGKVPFPRFILDGTRELLNFLRINVMEERPLVEDRGDDHDAPGSGSSGGAGAGTSTPLSAHDLFLWSRATRSHEQICSYVERTLRQLIVAFEPVTQDEVALVTTARDHDRLNEKLRSFTEPTEETFAKTAAWLEHHSPRVTHADLAADDDDSETVYYSVYEDVHEIREPLFYGLRFQRVTGNGHCLFNAVGRHLGQDHAELRNRVADYLKENPGEFEEVIAADGISREAYIRRIRETREWGGNLEIEVIQRITGRPVVIIRGDANPTIPGNLPDYAGEPIFVYYNGHTHYDAFEVEEGHPREILARMQAEIAMDGAVLYHRTARQLAEARLDMEFQAASVYGSAGAPVSAVSAGASAGSGGQSRAFVEAHDSTSALDLSVFPVAPTHPVTGAAPMPAAGLGAGLFNNGGVGVRNQVVLAEPRSPTLTLRK